MAKQTKVFNIKKQDGKSTRIPGSLTDNSVILDLQGRGIFIGDVIKGKGFTAADTQKPFSQLSADLQKLALRLGRNPCGTVVTDADEERFTRAKALETEHEKQMQFLRSKGYSYQQEGIYVDSYVASVNPHLRDREGEMARVWILRNSQGEKVQFSKALLTREGYFGDAEARKLETDEMKKAEKCAVRERIERYFRETKCLTPQILPDHLTPRELEGSQRLWAVEPHAAIWLFVWNGSDGDDWDRNTYGQYIAQKYPYDAEIAQSLSTL